MNNDFILDTIEINEISQEKKNIMLLLLLFANARKKFK